MSCLTDVLSTDDIATLVNELHKDRDIWFALGVQLKVPLHDLRAIRIQYRNPADCLLEMLFLWLTRPTPTWQSVVDALTTAAVDRHDTAEHIERIHCSQITGIHNHASII